MKLEELLRQAQVLEDFHRVSGYGQSDVGKAILYAIAVLRAEASRQA